MRSGRHHDPVVVLAVVCLAVSGCATGDATIPTTDPPTPTVPQTQGGVDDGTGSDDGLDADTVPPPSTDGDESDGSGDPVVDLDVALTLTMVAEIDDPIAAAVGPDARLYVAGRAGTVRVLGPDGAGEVVLDIRGETTTDGERGLLGLAFAPDGSELYVSSTDTGGDTLVSAYPFSAGDVDRDGRRTVLAVDQPFANHNGGDLQVGPDGLLYIGLGDGGGGGDPLGAGQDLSTRLGSLLRIDPLGADPYLVPSDNPFVEVEGAAPEIYAYGLRNPWRFSFDRDTGDLWIADVGQNAREEINHVPVGTGAGANFGWSLREGTREYAGPEPDDHVAPVLDYGHDDGRCSVTGGFVYRGGAIPELHGVYLYTDLCDSTVRALQLVDGRVVEERALGVAGSQVVSFAQDADGELYLLDFAGTVWRLDPA